MLTDGVLVQRYNLVTRDPRHEKS